MLALVILMLCVGCEGNTDEDETKQQIYDDSEKLAEGYREIYERAAEQGDLDTLEELARIIGVDGSSLCASIERWNAFVEKGCDEDFGRRMHKPLSEKRITAEACVSHLMFCDDDYKTLGARIKCNPSVKTRRDRDALRRALTTDRIDVVGTDHAPHLLSEKQGGALKAVSGMPMLQFSLVSMFELVREGVLTVEQVVQKMCHAPAELFQIKGRGYIRPGYQADLVMVNPDYEWHLTPACIRSKCGWSPMENQTFHARVEKTWVNGALVYSDEKVDTSHRGQALIFER